MAKPTVAEKPFKKAKKMAAFDVVQRHGAPDCFGIGFLHFDDETVGTILNCSDFEKPKTAEEAVAVAKMCMYGGLVIPQAVYELAGEVDFTPKYVFSPMPFTENKKHCVAYAKARDDKYKKGFDQTAHKSLGGVADSHDVALNRANASKFDSSFASRIVISDSKPDFHKEYKLMTLYEETLDRYTDALQSTMTEIYNLRQDAKAKIEAMEDSDVMLPEMSAEYENVLLLYGTGNVRLDLNDDIDDEMEEEYEEE